MTKHWFATVEFAAVSGLPEDKVTNTFSFAVPDAATGVVTGLAIGEALEDVYSTTYSGFGNASIAKYLSRWLSRGTLASKVNVYDRAAPGSPLLSYPWTLPAVLSGAGPELPQEVAVVASFHGDLSGVPERSGSTRPASRRRGRVFIGPLHVDALQEGAGGGQPQTPQVNLIGAINSALNDLRDSAALAALDAVWEVYSEAAGAGYPVVGGYVDDAFDTQRRRGQAPTTRSVWS